MHILITGGTGTIGRRLIEALLKRGDEITILSRRDLRPAWLSGKVKFLQWDAKTAEGWGTELELVDAVVNLAGAGLADERWTDERKKIILNSRLNAGRAVVEAIEAVEQKPKVLIQASGVGYYGTSRDKTFVETDGPGDDFIANICVDWEAVTDPVEAMGVRRVIIRTGVVLDPEGGALPKLVMPFRFFAGGPLGSGRQWMSWIHHADEVAAILFLIDADAAGGPVNLTAPNPVRNAEMAKTIGRVLGRPAFAPAPSPILKLVLGEMSAVVVEGQRVMPRRLQELGFEFKYPDLEPALRDLLG